MPQADLNVVLLRNVHRNLGDEAMLACEIDELRRFCGEGLTVLTDEPDRVARQYGVRAGYSDVTLINPWRHTGSSRVEQRIWSFPAVARPLRFLRNRVVIPQWRNRFLRAVTQNTEDWVGAQAEFVNTLRSASAVVMGGGLVPSVQHLESARIAVLRALKHWDRPVILHGVTVFRRHQPDAAYRLASTILTRDHASVDNSRSCGVPAESIIEGVDPAFALAPASEAETTAFLEQAGIGKMRFAAVNARSGLDMEPFARRIRELAGQGRFERVLLFAMQDHGAENDSIVLGRMRMLLGDLAGPIVPRWPNAGLLKSVLSRAVWAASCRYHGVVFALCAGCPVLANSVSPEYDAKLLGILEQFGRTHWLERASRPPDAARRNEMEWFAPNTPKELAQRWAALARRTGALIETLSRTLNQSNAAITIEQH